MFGFERRKPESREDQSSTDYKALLTDAKTDNQVSDPNKAFYMAHAEDPHQIQAIHHRSRAEQLEQQAAQLHAEAKGAGRRGNEQADAAYQLGAKAQVQRAQAKDALDVAASSSDSAAFNYDMGNTSFLDQQVARNQQRQPDDQPPADRQDGDYPKAA